MSDFLNDLNPVQLEAVRNTNGPSLIIAGAGSGKTRVLTYKIAHLLDLGISSWSILALTFTNKAAKEMKSRIVNLVGEEQAKNLWAGTFHSRFATILRMEADKLGFPSSFSIYDTVDSRNLIKQIIKELNLDDKIYKTAEVAGRISSAKNNLITASAYKANDIILAQDTKSRKPEIGNIYVYYEKRCRQAGAMDFDDLLLKTNILFRDFPEVLEKYQNKFRYILVDEYQDTNYAQYLIIKKLAEKHKNVCVVGDDAQSIYAFRGAKIENILNFRNDYPEYKLFKLEQNYRSTRNIVDAANSLIAKNKKQIQKEVFSKNATGEKINLIKAYTDSEEGIKVANSIMDIKLQNLDMFNDFAILYRTNAQSRIMEEAMRKLNIPYRIYGGISFYQRKEVKDLIAYFRLVVNNKDEESLKRIINYPARAIGKTTMEKLENLAFEKDLNIWDIITKPGHFQTGLNNATTKKLADFADMISRFSFGVENRDAYESAIEIAKGTGILKELHDNTNNEAISRLENIHELLNGIMEFTTTIAEDRTIPLAEFLENIALLTDQDTDKEDDKDKLTMMTVHAAKGLEFKHVFIVGMEENLFPSRFSAQSSEELEEERRLFYVAITRAKETLSVSYAKSRFNWGDITDCKPSRFIKEIDSQYVNGSVDENNFVNGDNETPANSNNKWFNYKRSAEKNPTPQKVAPPIIPSNLKKIKRTPDTQENLSQPVNTNDLKIGANVFHERFGEGQILNLEGSPPNQKATVLFKTSGQKQLLLKFAKLQIVN